MEIELQSHQHLVSAHEGPSGEETCCRRHDADPQEILQGGDGRRQLGLVGALGSKPS